ncbi:MAG: cupin domain-containing protein [Saprospiraceae bacterium]|nr:cupin domain-containing protein [Saprospiraceae bacterium]
MKISVADLPPFIISKGFTAQMFHTENMTLAYVDVEAGAELPEHSHFHEQVSNMLEGEFEFVLDGEKMLLRAGDCLVIPSNMPHSGRAITRCRILDVFQPVREDFRKGEVAYAKR